MKEGLVEYYKEDFVIGTWKLSKGFKVEHRALKNLVNKYKSEFEELGFVTSPMQQRIGQKRKQGRQIEEFLLNEPQATYLSTLLTNNEIVRSFKLKLTKEFFLQRKLLTKILSQKQNAEWLEKRTTGKLDRRIETDSIKDFVEYATGQGSKSANKYYMAISKMENAQLFFLELLNQKFPNIREICSTYQLTNLQTADRIVARALKEGMEKKMHYKEIYQMAKKRVENFAELIGKSPLMVSMEEKPLELEKQN